MLTLIATPIGNLGDITLRAVDELRAADIVACEDTRKSGRLLQHLEIKKPLLSYHEHNERQATERIIAMLQAGQRVALITDAGTPGVADPGYRIVRRAIDEGLPVTMTPGPAALTMAVVLSGLAVHSFTYRGFAPRKPGPRRRFLAVDARSPHTLIFYESPFRIAALLRDALEVYGDRQAALCAELTKLYERIERGTLSALLEHVTTTTPKGEYVLVVAGAADGEAVTEDEE